MDEQQRQAFEAAVEDKKAAAQEASERTGERPPGGSGNVKLDAAGEGEPGLTGDDRNQDVYSVRDKNSGHGKKTADKWNQ
jgi:hypothetical protein